MALIATAGGAAAGLGVWLAVAALMPGRGVVRGTTASRPSRRPLNRGHLLRAVAAVVAALLVLVVTGWPVAAALAAAGCWWLPVLLGPDRVHERQVAGIEAVASWTEMLRDLMAGASGLHQAITATVPIAPTPIRADVERLGERLRTGTPPQEALTAFAEDVDNPTADLVASALASAANRHAADLGTLLGSLAEAAREQSALLGRVAASRSRVRTSTRIIALVTLGMAAFLLFFSPGYLDPFDGFVGQIVLGAIGGLWATAMVWLVRLARPNLGPRVLAPTPEGAAA